MIQARIEKDGYDKKLYQRILDEIIHPLKTHYEKEVRYTTRIISVQKADSIKNPVDPSIGEIPDKNSISTSQTDQVKTESEDIKENEDKITPLPQGFMQITCKADKEQILDYFMILSKERNKSNMKPYMDAKDIKGLVEKNFIAFKCKPTGRYFPINLNLKQKGMMRDFITQFYKKYEDNIQVKEKYACFLIHNFEIFKDDKLESLVSNMGNSKRPDTFIPVEKYLP
jgi:hypothetical protein